MTKVGMFDTHAHYNDEKFLSAENGQEGILSYVLENGVDYIMNASTDIEDSRSSIALAKRYGRIYATAGIHPHESGRFAGDIDGAMAELEMMIKSEEKVLALGEIGLDFHYDFSTPEDQKKVFEAQLILARELDVPVVIHDREAHGATMDMLRRVKVRNGIMHSFSGSAQMAKELERIGFYISFSGSVTFKNAVNLQEAAKVVSKERLLIETDAPYLAPVPMRGRTNNSALMIHTAGKLAEIRGVELQELIHTTTQNAKELLFRK